MEEIDLDGRRTGAAQSVSAEEDELVAVGPSTDDGPKIEVLDDDDLSTA